MLNLVATFLSCNRSCEFPYKKHPIFITRHGSYGNLKFVQIISDQSLLKKFSNLTHITFNEVSNPWKSLSHKSFSRLRVDLLELFYCTSL